MDFSTPKLRFHVLVWVAGILGAFRVNAELVQLNNDNIHDAVDEWFSSRESAEANYGRIEEWDTSDVWNMHSLFKGRQSFNEDISGWNTSSVVTLGYMFNGASSFNQDLSTWDTTKCRFLDGVFNFATSFNGDISTWNTEQVISLDFAFSHAASFNGDITSWNTSSLKYLAFTFWNATSFSQNLSPWDISNVDDIIGMFYNASAFDQSLCWDLNLEDASYATRVFCGSPGSFDQSCGNQDLFTMLDWGCLEPQTTSAEDSLLETVEAESNTSIEVESPADVDAIHQAILDALTSEKPASDAEDPEEALHHPPESTTPEAPISDQHVSKSTSETSKLSTEPEEESQDHQSMEQPTYPSSTEFIGEQASSHSPNDHPGMVHGGNTGTTAHSGTIMTSHAGHNMDDHLKYAAIAFCAMALSTMTFLFFFVIYKHRQIKRECLAQDACTVQEAQSDSEECTAPVTD